MRKKLLTTTLLSVMSILWAKAQVSDVSLVVAPVASYNWFAPESTIKNGMLYGLQAGFSFGSVIELKGVYERSKNLSQKFLVYDRAIRQAIPGFTGFENGTITATRYGGEFKTNIPLGSLSPYLLLGVGVQQFDRQLNTTTSYKNESLYGNLGLGLKFNLGKRITLNLEGRSLLSHLDPKNLLHHPGGTAAFDNWVNAQNSRNIANWSTTAGLQFYLGGTNTSNFTALEKAYFKRFSGGLSGFKLTLSPAMAYLDFNSNTPYRDTYLLGGQLGLDLTDYVGLKAYYYRANSGSTPSLTFDELAVFGLDFVGRLNVPRGIVPYIAIGVGSVNVMNNYQGAPLLNANPPAFQSANSAFLAKGGLGLEIPLGRHVAVYAAANMIYTVDQNNVNPASFQNPNQLQQSRLYNFGLKVKLGKKARASEIPSSNLPIDDSASRINYQQKSDSLENALVAAFKRNDIAAINQIIAEKQALESKQQLLPSSSSPLIRLTPNELNLLIDKVIKGVEINEKERIEKRIGNLNRWVTDSTTNTVSDTTNSQKQLNTALIQLIDRMQKALKAMDTLTVKKTPDSTTSVVPSRLITPPSTTDSIIIDTVFLPKKEVKSTKSSLGVLLAAPFNTNSYLVGLRADFPLGKSTISFKPDAYAILAKKVGFGLNANFTVKILNQRTGSFSPYLAAGGGLNYLNKVANLSPNLIVGTGYQLGKGNAFLDYSYQSRYRISQIAIGYLLNI